MSDRNRSVRVAAAVSSILSAPAIAAGAGLVVALAAPIAKAQETTAQLNGFVVNAQGQPIVGAAVTIVHLPSGTSASTSTSATGQFLATGLRVGGPYRITARAPEMQEATVEDLFMRLAERTSVTLVAQPIAQLAGVEVLGISERDVTIGAGSRFGARDVRALPSISRDIKDVVRIDPKAWIDPTNTDALEVAGVNNRYNTITIDGVRQNDDFGLNAQGYPTERSPLSIDAIEAVSVLTAPFSVEYSHFRGSTINVVTKSGTNKFAGSAFYYKGDESLLGDQTKDTAVDLTFDEEIYGGTFGGPIIRDRLFFVLSYEKMDRTAPQDIGPAGSGFPVEVPGVTEADYDRIRQIGIDVYGFDPGEILSSAPEKDEKILAKLDWNINDSHRATLAYQRAEGNVLVVNSTNNNEAANRLGAPSNWYDRSSVMDSTSFQLFSDWNEYFSTEIKLARKEVETAQVSLFGTEFGEMQIHIPVVGDQGGGTVFIGSDEFRHASALANDLDAIKLLGSFFLGDHTLIVGYEREMLDIFNIFVNRSEGQWVFASIDAYEAQEALSLSYRNAFTNDANDGAATFGYDVDSFYVQNEWQATPDLKFQAGVRLDKFSSGDQPLLNTNFTGRYGFNNQSTLDGRDLMMPRFGFNWQWTPETTIYGGWGLFGGGTPNVWISNSFSNDGVTVVQTDVNPLNGVNPQLAGALIGVDGFIIPQEVLDYNETLRGDGPVNAVDPDFDIPSQYRWNLGMKHTLPWDIEMTADVIYSRVKDEVLWQDIRLSQIGTAPDGRPINAPNADRRSSSSIQDLVLTNTNEGEGTVFTIDVSKTWRTGAGRFDTYLGYGHQNIKDVNPGSSSAASSNWDNVAVSDPNDPGLETSNYEIEHQFKGTFSWRKAFFGDYETSVALVGERRSGRPYSFTFGGTPQSVWGDPRQQARSRQLFYVPDGDVIFESPCSNADVTAQVAGCATNLDYTSANAAAAQFASNMEAYIDQHGLERYRGRIMPRNSHRSPWTTILDLRFAQELPVFRKTRGVLTVDIENFANMLNKDWGQIRQVGFPFVTPVADVNRISTAGCPDGAASCYVYRPRPGQSGPAAPFESVTSLPSVWRVQLGIRIEF